MLDVYIAWRKKYIHIAFSRPLVFLENIEESLALVMQEWRNHVDQPTRKIIFLRFIHSISRSFEYLLFRKKAKKMPNSSNQGLLDEAIDSFFDMMLK